MNEHQFCIITPTAYLEKYASQSNMHLVLAHLVDKDETYANFYRNRTEFKIMDNGAFELGESYDPSRLIELGHKCKADVIVLPDYPLQPFTRGIGAAETVVDDIRNAGFKTMFVPQSERGDMWGWVQAYKWASLNDKIDVIGMSILGIPTALPEIDHSFARVVMTHGLIKDGIFNHSKHHHYLGLNAGPRLEIPSLLNIGALDSCDSSGPVWAGILGHRYSKDADSYQTVRKIKNEVDFDYPYVDDTDMHDRIQHNINLTLDLFDTECR